MSEWEMVWEGDTLHWLERMVVPGGWLYRYCIRDRRSDDVGVQIVYVPAEMAEAPQ
jgi:hypothetical protein